MSGDEFKIPTSEAWEVAPSMGNPKLRCVNIPHRLLIFVRFKWLSITLFFLLYAVKRRLKLKSKYQGHVKKAIEYTKMVESWDDLVGPRTFAFYCLGLDPSPYVLRIITIEGKKSKC